MINIIRKKIREQRNGVIYYALALIGYVWMLVGIFPSMKEANLEELTKNMPEEFMKFFGGEGFSSYSTIEGFLSLEFLSFFFILIISFYIASSAGSAIAESIEKKTIDFDLSQPISRIKVLLGNSIVTLIYSALLAIITSASIWLFCNAYDVSIKNSGLIAFTITAVLFLWSIFGYSILFSSILRSKVTVVLSTVGVTLISYIFLSLTNIVEKIKDYDKYSLFYLYSPQRLLVDGTVNTNQLAILVLVLIGGLLSSLLIFNKKDL